MPQQTIDEQFTFVAGLNTEAGYFTFPKNTWKDGSNLIPAVNGALSKRKCIDLELGYSTTTSNISASNRNLWAFTSHKWLAVGGDGDVNFIVAQMGRYVYFYNDTSISTSTTLKSFSIDLNTYKASGNPSVIGTAPIKAVSANGKLLITSQDTEPIHVTYNSGTDTITVAAITVQVRDFDGVDDGLAVTAKPNTLSTTHNYNLLNQGWNSTQITSYFSSKSVYPSNTQSWVHGKDTNDAFSPDMLDKQEFGTSPAPKGRYILSAFNKDRSTASGLVGLTTETVNYRPAVCAFFAGRAWYAGVKSDNYGSTVFFSQVAITTTNYGKCYQDADPTSEVISDLVDSDGGVIPIQDCGEIVDIQPNDNGLLVFATNGIWHIVGTSQSGFSASGYEVKKVGNFGCVGKDTIIEFDDGLIYWSYNGICKIGKDATISVLTDLNIKTLYTSIPPLAKQYCSGAYNSNDKTIYWLYNELLISDTTVFPYQKTTVLCLDTRLSAFYTLTLPQDTSYPIVTDLIVTREMSDTTVDYTVIDDVADTVVNSGGDTVIADILVGTAAQKQYKFLTIVPENGGTYEMTFSDFLTTDDAPLKFMDWHTYDNVGVEYDCYLETGYSFAPSGASRKKQAVYITTYLQRTETAFDVNYDPVNESSCLMRAKWDFTDNANPGKWSGQQQVYRHVRMFIPSSVSFDDGYPVVITKNKLRGRGRALQLRFDAETDKDMHLLGWSVVLVGE